MTISKSEELEELREAIERAQEENVDEVHCSCVPLLKARIGELEKEVRELRELIRRG
jgi:collagenase-like PrtC family protease